VGGGSFNGNGTLSRSNSLNGSLSGLVSGSTLSGSFGAGGSGQLLRGNGFMSGNSFKINPERLRPIADPSSQILAALHKLVVGLYKLESSCCTIA
jgi:hypothetical protein